MNNIIDISSYSFKLLFNDINKIYNLMKSKSFDVKLVRKITKNKNYKTMDHYNVLYLITKLAQFNKVKDEFPKKLLELNINSLNVDKNLVKMNYKDKDDDKKEKELDKDEEDEEDDEEEDKDDDNIDEKLVDIGIDDGVFRYLYFLDLEFKFLKIQIKKSFINGNNSYVYVNELLNIITSNIFSKYKDKVFILDINLQKQALNRYFNDSIDDNTCSICLTNINTELTHHHSIFCLNCSTIYCTTCYNKVAPICCICKKKF